MPTEAEEARLRAIGDRIDAVREARKPRPRADLGAISGASLAWRMVIDLVVGVLLGAAIGWGIDGLAGTLPLFLIIFGLLGFAAGVRVMLRSANEANAKGAGAQNTEGASAPGSTKKPPGG